MNGSPKGAMIGLLRSPTSPPPSPTLKPSLHSPSFAIRPLLIPPSSPTRLRGGKHQSLPYPATGKRFPSPLPSRSRNDRGTTLLPAGRIGSPSRGEEDTPSLPLGSPHRSSSGKRLQLAPVSIDADIPQELIIAQDRIHGLPAKMIRDTYAP